MRNRRFDEAKRVNGPKNQSRHHRTFPQSGRFPAMSALPPRPTQTKFGVPTQGKLFFELFLGFAPTAASRHREERSDPFMIDSCKICFQKTKQYLFLSHSLTRQQTTTNDCCRLQTFVQRLSPDKVCIFAASFKLIRLWPSKNRTKTGRKQLENKRKYHMVLSK